MPVGLQDAKGAPYPTEGYIFRLEIVPASFDRSWSSPPAFAQQHLAGSGSAGATFVLSDSDTGGLDYRTAYHWRVMAVAPSSDPSALIGGNCTVIDGPVVPEVNPLLEGSSRATVPIATLPVTVKMPFRRR